MWLASMMKTTAVVSAAFAAAGIAWAVEAGGGQGNKHAAASDASVVELRTAAGADKQVVIADASKGSSADSSQLQPPSGIGTITVTGGPSRPLPPGLSVGRTGLADALVAQRNIVDVLGIATQAAESTADREKKCDDQLTELRKRVATNQKEKLDYIQLLAKQKTEESLIQRELDRTHESLVMLRLSPPDNGASDDARKKHAGQVDKLQTLVEEVKERMATASRNSALTSAQVEQVDLELSELSKMKSEVARMKLQMEFAPPQAATGPRSDLRTQLRGVIIDTTGVPPTEQKVEEVIGRIIDSAPERVNTVDVARSADTPKGAAGAVWQAKSGDGVTNTATLTIDPSVDQGTISISTASPEQTSRLEKERSAWRQKALTYRLNADHAEAMALEIDQQLKVLAKPKPQSHVDRAAVQRLQDENEILKKQLDDMKARIRDANKAK